VVGEGGGAEDMHALLCVCIMHGRKHLYPFKEDFLILNNQAIEEIS
jgi:hypothetical protein